MDNSKVLATVGQRQITSNDIEAVISGLNPQSAAQFNSEEGKKRLLEELINQELLYLEAIDNGMEDSQEYKLELERAKANILKQIAMNKLLSSVTVEEGEVIKYYNDNKDHFKKPETVRASHILVDSEEKANKILSEIKNGLSFEEAAKQNSSCPSNAEGGDLGYFQRNSMVPEFENTAFNMEKDEIKGPVKTGFGYHIIKLVDKKEGGQKSFDEVKNQIAQQVLLKKQQDLYLSKTSKLRNSYEVKVNI